MRSTIRTPWPSKILYGKGAVRANAILEFYAKEELSSEQIVKPLKKVRIQSGSSVPYEQVEKLNGSM